MDEMNLAGKTIVELRDLLDRGEIQPMEIVDSVIAAAEVRDEALGGYLSWDRELAASACEGPVSGPLAGIPIAIKDLINVRGQRCGCASKILEGYVAPYDATSVVKLREAGGHPFGRTNMDEFAMGSSNENSGIKLARNPWDPERIPGGSSGGSAVVVAADEAVAALGSDTGGRFASRRRFVVVLG